MNVLGGSYRFNNDLQLTIEHLFNGIGDSDNLDASNIRYQNGVSTTLNNQLTGFSLDYQITPLLNAHYSMKSAWDNSSQQNFSIIKSISDNIAEAAPADKTVPSIPKPDAPKPPDLDKFTLIF